MTPHKTRYYTAAQRKAIRQIVSETLNKPVTSTLDALHAAGIRSPDGREQDMFSTYALRSIYRPYKRRAKTRGHAIPKATAKDKATVPDFFSSDDKKALASLIVDSDLPSDQKLRLVKDLVLA